MSRYTELLNIRAETLSPDDDGYEESLREIAALFRGFGEALTAFMEKQGYKGDLSDVPAKAQFLREKFKAANIKPPRDFQGWFVPNKKLSRKTAFQICFAFGLDVDGTNDFFRCVQLERGFDCHTISEAVYYFCMRNGLSYSEAQDMIAQIPVPPKAKAIPSREALYTGTIMEYIDSIEDREKLIQYITDNIEDFQYNHVTAITYIQKLWIEIAKEEGFAEKEGKIIEKFNWHPKKSDDYVTAASGSSTWTIFSQIIGLSQDMENEYAAKYDRSLTSILTGNALMPLNASYCFPSQHSIDKILRGEPGDHELMRKMLIFLVFYSYWVKKIIQSSDAFYIAKPADSERCLDTIDSYLSDAGYPQMYAGNPYDWLFWWALNNEHPLEAFRTYMGEVFTVKGEQEDGKPNMENHTL